MPDDTSKAQSYLKVTRGFIDVNKPKASLYLR